MTIQRPAWADEDRIREAAKRLPARQATPRVKTLRGSRPSLANVATLKDYTRAHDYAKRLDGINANQYGSGFKPYMRHAR